MQSDTDYSISSNIKPSFFEEMIMKKNIFRLFVGTFVVPFYFYETKSLHIAFFFIYFFNFLVLEQEWLYSK